MTLWDVVWLSLATPATHVLHSSSTYMALWDKALLVFNIYILSTHAIHPRPACELGSYRCLTPCQPVWCHQDELMSYCCFTSCQPVWWTQVQDMWVRSLLVSSVPSTCVLTLKSSTIMWSSYILVFMPDHVMCWPGHETVDIKDGWSHSLRMQNMMRFMPSQQSCCRSRSLMSLGSWAAWGCWATMERILSMIFSLVMFLKAQSSPCLRSSLYRVGREMLSISAIFFKGSLLSNRRISSSRGTSLGALRFWLWGNGTFIPNWSPWVMVCWAMACWVMVCWAQQTAQSQSVQAGAVSAVSWQPSTTWTQAPLCLLLHSMSAVDGWSDSLANSNLVGFETLSLGSKLQQTPKQSAFCLF